MEASVNSLNRIASLAGALLAAVAAASPATATTADRSELRLRAEAHTGRQKIAHVVVLVQQSRTFNTLFAGFPGAQTESSGVDSHGNVVPLKPVPLADPVAIRDSHEAWETAFDDGRLDGFNLNAIPPSNAPYAFVRRSDIAPYWAMARTYATADHFFAPNTGPSFPAGLYLIAAQADDVFSDPNASPWGCDSPPGTVVKQYPPTGKGHPILTPPCFNIETIATPLDAAKITWRMYAPAIASNDPGRDWNAFDAIAPIRHGPDWGNIISPETQVLADIANGQLSGVTYVVPSFANSDLAVSGSATGPKWVSTVVDAIGNSPFWDSTAIVVVWSSWGGWYEGLAGPTVDVEGLGFRAPMVVVSPYAKHGYISHTLYTFGSVLKFVEGTFGLPSLGQSDATANDLLDSFDFTQRPSRFHPF